MEKYVISNFEDYELHYSKDQQLVWSKRNEKYLKLKKHKEGYLRVCLSKNGKQKYLLLHRLVWQCLKGEIPKDLQINHIDEVKTNNSIENLELVTPKQNSNHGTHNARIAKANKISLLGNQNAKGKLINRQDLSKSIVAVKKDLSEILNYPSIMEAERDRGFHYQNISQCCQNKRKSHQGYIWFYQQDFDSYMDRFNNLEKVIEYKSTLVK